MSQGIEPEAIQPPTPRRGKWGRRIFRGCLVFLALLVLFHQLLLTHALRLVAIRLAAGENIQLSLEVEGSVWTYLTLKNVRAASTGTSPVDSIRIIAIQPLADPSSTERTYRVIFEIKVKGQGVSMQSGRCDWNYYLTWDAKRGSWLITNYGAG